MKYLLLLLLALSAQADPLQPDTEYACKLTCSAPVELPVVPPVVVPPVVPPVVVPPVADICGLPGVFVCDQFDNPATLAGTIYPGDSTAVVEDGMLRFTIPSMSGANAGGEYRVSNFPSVGEGQSIYIAYRIRANKIALESKWPTRKHFILWRGSSSCTDLEFVNSYHWGGTPWLLPNGNCGALSYMRPHESNPHNYYFQYSDNDETGYRCTRGDVTSTPRNSATCAFSEPDVWDEFYIQINVGTFNADNSTLIMWHRKPGQPFKKYIERQDARFNNATPSTGFHQFMLTVYMTGKKPAEHPPGHVDYDYLVMSRQPFLDALEETPDGSAPAWVADMQPGVWEAVNLNTLKSVDPEDDPLLNPRYPKWAPWHYSSGQDCVLACWNGGAFATEYGEHGSLLVYGGGHLGYGGSEVYAFDMTTRLWHRVTDPYPVMPEVEPIDVSLGIYADGSPLPAHVESSVGYNPVQNEFVVFRSVFSNTGNTAASNVKVAHMLNLDTKTWRRSPYPEGAHLQGAAASYDAIRHQFYLVPDNGQPLGTMNAGTGAWTWNESGYSGVPINTNSAIDPNSDLLLVAAWRASTACTACPVYIVDLQNPAGPLSVTIQSGDIPARYGQQGFEWSDKLQGMVYAVPGTGDVYLMTKDVPLRTDRNWTWRQIATSETYPEPSSNGTGSFNKFRIARYGDEEIAVVTKTNTGPVWAMRLK